MTESERAARIAEHRADMPKVYRGIYDKAVAGRSLRSAVNSFCLECTMWQREEVRLCTSFACQFYPYRPYQLNDTEPASDSNLPPQEPDSDSEQTNTSRRIAGHE